MKNKFCSLVSVLLLVAFSLAVLPVSTVSAKSFIKPQTPPIITCGDNFTANFDGPDGVVIETVDPNWQTFSGYPAVYDTNRMKMYTLVSNPSLYYGNTLGPVVMGDFDLKARVEIPRSQHINPEVSYNASVGFYNPTLFGAYLSLKEDDNTNSKVQMRIAHTGGEIFNTTVDIVNARTVTTMDLRLVKSGDTFTGYYRNQAEWVMVGSVNYVFNYGGNLNTGFTATNRQTGAAVDAIAWFDNISVVCPTPLKQVASLAK